MSKKRKGDFKDALREVLRRHHPEYKDPAEIVEIVDEMAAVAIEGKIQYPRQLPLRAGGHTLRVDVNDTTLFIRTTPYGDGSLGELHVDMSGNPEASKLMEAIGAMVTIAAQWDVPLDVFTDYFATEDDNSGADSPLVRALFKSLAEQFPATHPASRPKAPSVSTAVKTRAWPRLAVNNTAAKPGG